VRSFAAALDVPALFPGHELRGFWSAWASTYDRSRWPEPPRAEGRPVLLIPGFLAGDPSLTRMAVWLRGGGFETRRSGIAINVDCTEALALRLERRLAELVAAAGEPAVVIGQSRGGVLGWLLAVRRPELVAHLVTLGSPLRDQLDVFPTQWLGIGAVGLLGTLGMPGFFGLACQRGRCCARARRDLEAPLPESVRCTAFYSRRDRVVRWRSCIPEQGEAVEVCATHLGMGLDAQLWRALARRL
jgi:triacylglycerol lipase